MTKRERRMVVGGGLLLAMMLLSGLGVLIDDRLSVRGMAGGVGGLLGGPLGLTW